MLGAGEKSELIGRFIYRPPAWPMSQLKGEWED
jgi:hypothetical protein